MLLFRILQVLVLQAVWTTATTSPLQQRTLQENADALQELVSQVVLQLPDMAATETILMNDLDFSVTNVQCSNILLGDLRVLGDKNTLTADVSQLDLVCDMDYQFKYVLLFFPTSGSGNLRITMKDNSMAASLEFLENDSGLYSNVTLEDCQTNFQVSELEFSNSQGISSDILNALDGVVQGFVEDEIGSIICQDLDGLIQEGAADLLVSLWTTLQPYLVADDTMEEPPSFLVPAPGVILIDIQDDDDVAADWQDVWTQLQQPSWLTTLLGQLSALRLGQVWNETDTNLFGMEITDSDLGINLLLREYLLDEDRALTLTGDQLLSVWTQVLDPMQEDGLANVTLDSASVYGLDTFQTFVLLEAHEQQPYTLNNDFSLEYVRVEVDLTLHVQQSSSDEDSMILDPNGALALQEKVKLSVQLDDIDATILLLLAIDQDKFGQLRVGPLLYDTSSLVDCLVSSVFESKVSAMKVTVGNIQQPTLASPFLSDSPMLQEALQQALVAAMTMYKDPILQAIPNLFQDEVRGMVNDYFFQAADGEKANCPELSATGNQYLDFRDFLLVSPTSRSLGGSGLQPYGSLIPSLAGWAKSQLASEKDLIIDSLVSATGGSSNGKSIYFPDDLAEDNLRIWLGDLDARITYRIWDARIENIDTIGEQLEILDPVANEASLLNNSASIGVVRPLRVGGRLLISVETEDEVIKNDMYISADLSDLTMAMTALVRVLEDGYASFPIRDLFNIDCWLATIPSAGLDEFGLRLDGMEPNAAVERIFVSMKTLNMKMECLECTSPMIRELAELWSDPEVTKEMTDAVSKLISSTSTFLTDGFLQLEIDRKLYEATKRCPHSPQFDANFVSSSFQEYQAQPTEGDAATFAMILVIVIASLVVVVGTSIFLVRCFVRRHHSVWLKTLPNEGLLLLANRQKEEEEKESELNETSRSMFASSGDIPVLVRFFIPVIIVGNIALFLSGHLSVAAEVRITAQIAGQTLSVDDVYSFSMVNSAIEIWNAGGYVLALGILVFAGIWPYTKQLISLSLWFLPPSRCSISRRGSILLWLDFLAKWSIVDIFTLVMTVAAFRLSIQSPVAGFLPEGLYSADLLIVPQWGLYANLIAQLISQISSHFIIHYHRSIVKSATKVYRQKQGLLPPSLTLPGQGKQDSTNESIQSRDLHGERKDRLCETRFSRPHRAAEETLVVRRYVNAGIIGVAVLVWTFIIVGCTLPSVGLEFLGILGVAVEIGQEGEAAVRELSFFGLLSMMMEQAAFVGTAREYVGLGFLCLVMVCTVLLVPLIQTAVLLYQWLAPLSVRSRKRVSTVVECLQAWQYAEVYIISVIVASWQIGSISTHLFNEYCEDAKDSLNMLAYFGAIGENDAQCFRTNASIMAGCYFMAAGALLLAILSSYVLSANAQYFRARDEENDRFCGLQQHEDMAFVSTPMTQETTRTLSPVFSDNSDLDKSDEDLEFEAEGGKMTAFELPAEGAPHSNEEDHEERQLLLEYIAPTRVLFTDKFGWTLCPDSRP